jgi:hypothetical protein
MFFINPFIYAGGGDFESIATVTVGSGGAATMTLDNIPSTYQHLQIRACWRITGSNAAGGYANLRFNDDSGSNYAWHSLYGTGSSATAAGGASSSTAYVERIPTDSQTSSVFGGAVVDILDYASTSKYKTIRAFAGYDANGSGYTFLYSNLWMSTSALTKILFTPTNTGWAEYSTVALYGVKAP